MGKDKNTNNYVFGLDIGTRSIVGVVGYLEYGRFKIAAMAEKLHTTRSMLDGQIHDIYKVGDTIRQVKLSLESQLDTELKDVCIAAAGRVLRTVNSTAEYEFEEETRVTQEDIYSLNLLAVEHAHNQINDGTSKEKFYCVGNTPIRYQLNDYDIGNLEGHKARKIYVELIATFLPEEVVDGLYEAVEYAGLNVASLTLEPIASMNIAIPEQYRLLNICLVDAGAGTSDICITKDGSIVAYGMIPLAGDEITEKIAKNYLVDFNTAETIKIAASNPDNETVTFNDIMGLEQTVAASEIQAIADDSIANMAKSTADRIIELNGGKSVNAVFVVGGGGKMPSYVKHLADDLSIAPERVAIRGKEVLTTVDFNVEGFKKDSLYVTPVGICTNYYTQKNKFIFVNVNNERIKLYDNNKLTVFDAIMQIGYPNEKLFPRRGKQIEYMLNGKTRLVRGLPGEGAVITLNKEPASLNTEIEQNDIIFVKESTMGEAASITLGEIDEFGSDITFSVNEKNIVCPRFAYVNGELKSEFYDIRDGDAVRIENFYTVEQLFKFLDLDYTQYDIMVNNMQADKMTKVYENFTVNFTEKKEDEFDESAYLQNSDDEEYSGEAGETVGEPAKAGDGAADENAADVAGKDNVSGSSVQDDESVQGNRGAGVQDNTADGGVKAQGNTASGNEIRNITIIVNSVPVTLSGRSSYMLVDLFQFYDFDLSSPKGNIVILLNGEKCEYTAPIDEGDVIKIYWE